MDTKSEIIDLVGGAETWDDIANEFSGKDYDEIKAELDYMYPQEDNADLAQKIYDELDE